MTKISLLVFVLVVSTQINTQAQGQVSPDGKRLVSYEAVGDQFDIYIQSFSGEKHFITTHEYPDYNPRWSSDGKEIIFYRKHPDKNLSTIHIYDVEKEVEREVINSGHYDGDPSISNDGSVITFTSNRDGNFDIYQFNIRDEEMRSLISNDAANYGPAWAPKGKKIVFTSNMDGNFELYTVNSNGDKLKKLTNSGGENYKPDWSPDGKWIAFFHRDSQDSKFDLMIVSAKGKRMINVSASPEEDEYTCGWSGTEVFFYVKGGIDAYDTKTKKIRAVLRD